MGTFSIWHWLIVLAVVLILFGGKGKISQIMGDVGKGLRAFKKSVKDEDAADEQPAAIEDKTTLRTEPQRSTEPARERDRVAKS